MKKRIGFIILTLSVGTLLLLAGSDLFAQGAEKDSKKDVGGKFSIGATAWYAWWRPPWENLRFDRLLPWKNTVEVEPTFLGGPVFSYKINEKWGISALAIYGKYTTEKERDAPFFQKILSIFSIKAEAHRYDVDATVSYILHKYVKMFFGLKYQGYTLDLTMIQTRTWQQNQAGPGFGFGLILPIVSTFYFLPNVSGLLMAGKLADFTIVSAGANASASFAYYIPVIHTTIALGGRYHYLKYIKNDNPLVLREDDQFYGITMSVTFTF